MDSLRQLFQTLLNRQPGYKTHWIERQLIQRWTEFVGETIAKHAQPLRFKEGVLMVQVDHPIWKAELFRRKLELIEQIRKTGVLEDQALTDIHWVDYRSPDRRSKDAEAPSKAKAWTKRGAPKRGL